MECISQFRNALSVGITFFLNIATCDLDLTCVLDMRGLFYGYRSKQADKRINLVRD